MAFIFCDSFDFYNTTSSAAFNADAGTHWDTATNTGVISTTSRFGVGAYVQLASAVVVQLVKSSGSNDAGHHLAFAFRNASSTVSTNAATFTLMDGTTAQCSVVFDPSGPILLKSGLGGGATLATFPAGLLANIWYGVEVEVVINNTTGSFKVRLNGNTVDDFSATGLNTRGGTANNYANKIQIGHSSAVNTGMQIDDFLWFSTTGAAPNTWVGDIRAQQLMPVSDASVGLSNATGTYTQGGGGAATTSIAGAAANNLTTSPVLTVTYAGTIATIGVTFNLSYTGKFKLAFYDGSLGTPGVLLAQTAEVVNAVPGVTMVPLISGIVVAAGTKLFGAIIHDSTIPNSGVFHTNSSGYSAGAAYTTGFPASLSNPGIGTLNLPVFMFTNVANNTSQVNQATENGDTDFVFGSTAGVSDLYDLADLGATPSSIVAVQTRMCARKSDTGLRQARVQVKSGATTSNGATVTLGTSYSYQGAKVDTVDPNTGAAWTAAGVNALSIGVQVVT